MDGDSLSAALDVSDCGPTETACRLRCEHGLSEPRPSAAFLGDPFAYQLVKRSIVQGERHGLKMINAVANVKNMHMTKASTILICVRIIDTSHVSSLPSPRSPACGKEP